MHKLDPQTAAHVDKVLDDLQWDKWYATLPHDLKRKLAIHDFKRLGDVFKAAFAPSAAPASEGETAQVSDNFHYGTPTGAPASEGE
jgi:hypothetical protein